MIFRIEAHPEAGYLLSGREQGAHLLSADGRQLRCAPEGSPDNVWQRLLIAQVLPFAAFCVVWRSFTPAPLPDVG